MRRKHLIKTVTHLWRVDAKIMKQSKQQVTSFKGQNKGAAIYVESSTTLHNLLFYVLTLWLNNLTVTFLLVRCSCKIQTYQLFVQGQG